jgi:hypothetical protein
MYKEEGYIFVWETTTFFCSEFECKKYTRIYKECGLGLCIGVRKEGYVTNKIVRMGALVVLGEFSSIK